MTFPIDTTAHEELDYEPPSDYMVDERSPAGDRLRAIAAIHAYANWLTAHPDVEVPTSLDGHVHHHGDFDESVATTRAFIEKYGATKHTSGTTGWAILRVSAADSPIKVEHTVFTATRRGADDWL